MIINVFNFKEYKAYLSEKISWLGKTEKGIRQKIAEQIGCQPSYLSQVLNGKPDLTLDQAYKLNQIF